MGPPSTDDDPRSLPEIVRDLFWDTDASEVHLDRHVDQVIQRVLARGDWAAICWLRDRVGDAEVREWFMRTHGRGLDPPRLRFWELVLDLPEGEVDEWVAAMRKDPWHRRATA